MARKSNLELVYPELSAAMGAYPIKSFTKAKLSIVLVDLLRQLDFTFNGSSEKVITFLVKKGDLAESTINSIDAREVKLYTWRSKDEMTILSGLVNNSYYSFYTSLFLHQLTLQIPKTYYLNFEHSKLSVANRIQQPVLTQENIDAAFSKPQRKSAKHYFQGDKKIVITNGRFTNELGVISVNNGELSYRYTDLERTLIDIAIRPSYSGGVTEVLRAYELAKEKADIQKLRNYLTQMDFIYPYHQVIGFYLEKAGYSDQIQHLFASDNKYKFYLTYSIKNPVLSTKWNLVYPLGL